MKKLKPCPYCGSCSQDIPLQYRKSGGCFVQVICCGCEASGPSIGVDDWTNMDKEIEMAKEEWNRRAEVAEVNDLRQQLAESERMRLAYKRALEGRGCAWEAKNREGLGGADCVG